MTLLTEQGLQQFVLEDAENLQFADVGFARESGQSLVGDPVRSRRQFADAGLVDQGQGKRAVRVAYIVSVPVWKASYRMTLPGDAAAPKAALQGWATIENMSGQDWKGMESVCPPAGLWRSIRRFSRPTTSRARKCRSKSRAV